MVKVLDAQVYRPLEGGASFTFGRGFIDIAGEAALSVDRLPDGPGPQEGGGGPAAILRVTATGRAQELEATLRYYGIDHANPYARPSSQPDEYEGQRARDEVGARLRYARTGERLIMRALVDLWAPLSSLGADRCRSSPGLGTATGVSTSRKPCASKKLRTARTKAGE